MTDWQPIDTAPKDGTRVLICTARGFVTDARWSESACFGGQERDRPGWQMHYCDDDPWYSEATENATHWMPLPEPPSTEQR
jgi:hypothetical protein